jgi:hypothetical protein
VDSYIVSLLLLALLGLLLFDARAYSFSLFFSFGYQLTETGSFFAGYGLLNDRVSICRSHYWCIRVESLSQPSAHSETKVSRTSLTATRSPAIATLIINVHGIIAAQTCRSPLSSCLLITGLHDCFERSLPLATHLLPVDGFLLNLLDLRLEICKGRIAAL